MHICTCRTIIAIIFATPFAASTARVEVYRCVQNDAHISYQQTPCHHEDKPMSLKDRRSGWSPLRPGERSLLNSYRKKDAARHRKPSGPQDKPVKESKSCWSKRKQLEAVRLKLHRGYKLKEGGALRRKRNNYEDYLRQFCP